MPRPSSVYLAQLADALAAECNARLDGLLAQITVAEVIGADALTFTLDELWGEIYALDQLGADDTAPTDGWNNWRWRLRGVLDKHDAERVAAFNALCAPAPALRRAA